MDAGVPIKKPVAGIAMGLMVLDEEHGIVDGEYVVLTDIQGLEDHIGDMDFKVAGTADGITALQMDIKVKGITMEVLAQALKQAKSARLRIMDVIKSAISEPRKEVSQWAPKIETITIKPDQIGTVIGSGGKIIKEIIEVTGAEVDINDDGRVCVSAVDPEAIKKAVDWVIGLTREVEMNEVFEEAEITSVVDFGAFARILPGREGLIHVSQMSSGFIKSPSDVVKQGDKVRVTVIKLDEDTGKIGLSMLSPEDQAAAAAKDKERRDARSGGRGGFRGSDRRGGSRPPRRDFRR